MCVGKIEIFLLSENISCWDLMLLTLFRTSNLLAVKDDGERKLERV